jgi:hypothetical protein
MVQLMIDIPFRLNGCDYTIYLTDATLYNHKSKA